MDCGEQALLPAVRSADPATLIVADGFSCKTQIAQAVTGRRALHVAQVMKLARDHRVDASGPPEEAVDGTRPPASAARRAARIGITAAVAAGTAAALATASRTRR